MFHLEKPDILPLGDLAICNGLHKHFEVPPGAGKSGALHEVKDAATTDALLEPFRPYQSLVAWCPWRVQEPTSYDEAME